MPSMPKQARRCGPTSCQRCIGAGLPSRTAWCTRATARPTRTGGTVLSGTFCMRSALMVHSRRGFLVTAGFAALDTVALRGFPGRQRAQSTQAKAGEILVLAKRDYAQGRFYFDPVGLFVEVGQTVRWENSDWGFNVSAFPPESENHELRIPDAAQPFDSGLMVEGASYSWTFRVEGTYD